VDRPAVKRKDGKKAKPRRQYTVTKWTMNSVTSIFSRHFIRKSSNSRKMDANRWTRHNYCFKVQQ